MFKYNFSWEKLKLNSEKTYHCLCGQEFTTPNKFNAHRSRCRLYIESKGIDFDVYLENIHIKRSASARKNGKIKSERAHIKNKLKLEIELNEWSKEKHICEKCGITMLEKFGSGRFCSRSCANSGHCRTEESRHKTSESQKLFRQNNPDLVIKYQFEAQTRITNKRNNNISRYLLDPKLCIACGSPIPYDLRARKTCCKSCFDSINGGFRQGSAKNYKYGTYKNIQCDSSYELAFLVYCLEHDISVSRNFDKFTYYVDNTLHNYVPDFKINNTYIEIKNYMTHTVKLKAESIPSNMSYKLLFGSDIQVCIDYCRSKYGNEYWKILYDPNKPSCNDIKTNGDI